MIDDNKKTNINAGVAAVAGIVAGAGAVIAGAMALKNKDINDKTKKFVDGAETKATEVLNAVKDQAKKTNAKVGEKLSDGKKNVEKASKVIKEVIESKQG
jgi:predicted lipid-binding transport protein (Tim44 family)